MDEMFPPVGSAGPVPVTPLSQRTRLTALLTALSASVLVFSELLAFDAAFVWIVGNRIGTTLPVIWGAAAIGLAIALYISFRFFRVGYENELVLSTPDDEAHLQST